MMWRRVESKVEYGSAGRWNQGGTQGFGTEIEGGVTPPVTQGEKVGKVWGNSSGASMWLSCGVRGG